MEYFHADGKYRNIDSRLKNNSGYGYGLWLCRTKVYVYCDIVKKNFIGKKTRNLQLRVFFTILTAFFLFVFRFNHDDGFVRECIIFLTVVRKKIIAELVRYWTQGAQFSVSGHEIQIL